MMPILLTVIIGSIGLSFDFGNTLVAKNKAQAVTDSVALAGAKMLSMGSSYMNTQIQDFMQRNGYSVDSLTVETPYQGDNELIKVELTVNVPYYFSKVLGKDSQTIQISSVAKAGIKTYQGNNPVGVPADTYLRGQPYQIKSGTGGHGNYGAVALGGNGANDFRNNLKFGYQGDTIAVGDVLQTKPGKMKGPTSDGFYYRYNRGFPGETWSNYTEGNPRVVLVVMVDPSPYDVHGRGDVTITKFALFFLESYQASSGGITAQYIGDPADYPLGEGQMIINKASLVE